jgi:fermentation-respiration switch protein FrsA (DUF1100 family)
MNTNVRRPRFVKYFLPVLIMGLLLVACGSDAQPSQTPEPQDVAQQTSTNVPPAPVTPTSIQKSPTATTEATATTSPQPTATPTPTATATPSATPTNTPTPTPPHPLSVEWMRQQEYPGSEIVIEETLEPGANYHRYITSYSSEGLKIYALLTVPMGEKPVSGWPVVVFNHGYIPPEQYRTTERYVAYVDGFARNGYIVFRSDYRGHGSSEGAARGSYGTPDYTIDVLNAVAAIKNYPDADPDRIGMWGHSMGGYITLRSMVTTGDVKAGVIWAGVVGSYPDLFERWRRRSGDNPTPTPDPNSTRGRWRQDLLNTYGSPADNPEFWASISANSFLEDLSGPVQLHHGTADTSVPIEFSATLYEQIQGVGGTVEYYVYEGDDHNISTSFGLAMQRSIAFFDTYVK